MTMGHLPLEALKPRDILVSAPLAGGGNEDSKCMRIATRELPSDLGRTSSSTQGFEEGGVRRADWHMAK